jgi:hypothetical protein
MTEAGRALIAARADLHFYLAGSVDGGLPQIEADSIQELVEAIEREAYEQAKADAIAAVEAVDGLGLAPHRDVRNDAIVEREAAIAAIRDLHP